ncbi:MAG: hypothetical protein AB3X44_19235, partial [Leptothrix sp. (in: b-proteobacteria)]
MSHRHAVHPDSHIQRSTVSDQRPVGQSQRQQLPCQIRKCRATGKKQQVFAEKSQLSGLSEPDLGDVWMYFDKNRLLLEKSVHFSEKSGRFWIKSDCISGSVGIFVCEAGPDFQGMRWTNRWWILRCHTVESIAVGDGELI